MNTRDVIDLWHRLYRERHPRGKVTLTGRDVESLEYAALAVRNINAIEAAIQKYLRTTARRHTPCRFVKSLDYWLFGESRIEAAMRRLDDRRLLMINPQGRTTATADHDEDVPRRTA